MGSWNWHSTIVLSIPTNTTWESSGVETKLPLSLEKCLEGDHNDMTNKKTIGVFSYMIT